ncbi:MAG: mitochondrial import inner membrane translocase subunit tim21 [Pycnora praestabilis]|nr:MAG: mitochondrial import inner membrane translocase subunit tim21 [Pycnora praestabilis]
MHAWGKTSYRALRPAFALRNSVRTSRALGLPVYLLPATGCRHAAQNSLGATNASTTRKQVTVTGDDGRVRWGELSNREKAARTTQQSFNFLTILTGIVLTGGVITFLYLDVFSPDSKTNHFNRAVNQLRKDPQCIELLGNGKQIKAYGEPSGNKWSRNRPIAYGIPALQAPGLALAM